jgi:hypothetical protein
LVLEFPDRVPQHCKNRNRILIDPYDPDEDNAVGEGNALNYGHIIYLLLAGKAFDPARDFMFFFIEFGQTDRTKDHFLAFEPFRSEDHHPNGKKGGDYGEDNHDEKNNIDHGFSINPRNLPDKIVAGLFFENETPHYIALPGF